jgi:membrane-bound lytic murein transglycosylase MltF
MQLMPKIGQALKVGDIHQLEPNIHAGCRYLHTFMDSYIPDQGIDPLNRAFLAFAA